MNRGIKEQILYAWRELELEIEIIAQQLELEVREVQEVIAEEEGLGGVLGDLSNPDQIVSALKYLAKSAKSEKVRRDALVYLHRELTGRNNLETEALELKKKRLQLDAVNTGFNIEKFNSSLRRAQEIKKKVLELNV